jgi:hypothetical protein
MYDTTPTPETLETQIAGACQGHAWVHGLLPEGHIDFTR